MEPETFGRYRLLQSIGRGGMAEVFLAKQEGIAGVERRLAIKRIHPQFTSDENFVKMFIDEARIVGHFSHQNIVQMLDFGKIRDTYYIAMEYVDGVSLAGIMGNCLKGGVRIPPEAIIELGIQIGQGMDYAHNGTDENGQPLGIIHRDLTPHNILVTRAGTVKITDFGIAKASMNTHMTQAGMIKGKVPYMSPEQAMGQPLDKRSDLFSIGIILYEMCVLQRLFHGTSDFHVLQKVIAADIPSIRKQNPDVSEELERIVMKLLQQNRDDRYLNAGELADALRHLKFSMGETFSRFNLGAYVIHVIEEPETAHEEAAATMMAPDRSKGPSAFEGLGGGGGDGFDAGGGFGDDEDVRTVLMQAHKEDQPALGGEAPTRLIQTGETGRDEVMAALARAGHAEQAGEAATMMAPPPRSTAAVAAEESGEAATMMYTGPASHSSPEDGDAATMMAMPHDVDSTMLAAPSRGPRRVDDLAATGPALSRSTSEPSKGAMELPPESAPPRKGRLSRAIMMVGIVLAALMAIGLVVGRGAKDGSLTIQASPEGAAIYLNDEKVADNSIFTRDGLPPGQQLQIRIEKEGFLTHQDTLVLSKGQSLALPITLVPAPPPEATLELMSEPAGARIVIDGKATNQVTPARLSIKPDEAHTVSLELEGYQPGTSSVIAAGGESKQISLSLAPAAPAQEGGHPPAHP